MMPSIEAAKAWMDLNQLGRRNLSKEDRDELIRRLVAAGHKQKDVAEAVGLSKSRVTEIVKSSGTELAPSFTKSDLTVTAKLKDDLAAAERRIAELEARQTPAKVEVVPAPCPDLIPPLAGMKPLQEGIP